MIGFVALALVITALWALSTRDLPAPAGPAVALAATQLVSAEPPPAALPPPSPPASPPLPPPQLPSGLRRPSTEAPATTDTASRDALRETLRETDRALPEEVSRASLAPLADRLWELYGDLPPMELTPADRSILPLLAAIFAASEQPATQLAVLRRAHNLMAGADAASLRRNRLRQAEAHHAMGAHAVARLITAELDEALAKARRRHADNPALLRDLADLRHLEGLLARERETPDAARTALREAARLYARLLETASGDLELWQRLLDTHATSFALARAHEEPAPLRETALAYAEAAEKLSALRPHHRAFRTRYFNALAGLADTFVRLGELERARDVRRGQGARLLAALDEYPDYLPWRDLFTRNGLHLTAVQLLQGQTGNAVEMAIDSLARATRRDRVSRDLDGLVLVIEAQLALGEAHLHHGDAHRARTAWQRTGALLEELIALDTDETHVPDLTRRLLVGLGFDALFQGDAERAAQYGAQGQSLYLQAVALEAAGLHDLANRRVGDPLEEQLPLWRKFPWEAPRDVLALLPAARNAAASGDQDRADRLRSQGEAILADAIQLDASNRLARLLRARIYVTRADAAQARNDPTLAVTWLDIAAEHLDELAADDADLPRLPIVQGDVAAALASIREEGGRPADAQRLYHQAADFYRKALERPQLPPDRRHAEERLEWITNRLGDQA